MQVINGIHICECKYVLKEEVDGWRCVKCGRRYYSVMISRPEEEVIAAVQAATADTQDYEGALQTVYNQARRIEELEAQVKALREIAGEMAEPYEWQERLEHHSTYEGDGFKCRYCIDYYLPDVESEKFKPHDHAHGCPVRRLAEVG